MVFEERQKLNVWWVWGLLVLSVLSALVAIITSIAGAGGAGVGEIIGASVATLAVVVVLVVMAAMTMRTRIDEYGVETGIRPFVEKKFFWREVESVALEDHNNLQFGYKSNPFAKTESLAVNRGQVIVLRLRNGRQFRIGTQQPEEADAFLQRLFHEDGPADADTTDADLLEELQRVNLAQRR